MAPTLNTAWYDAETYVFNSLVSELGSTEGVDAFRGFLPVQGDGEDYKLVNVWQLTSGGSTRFDIDRVTGNSVAYCSLRSDARLESIWETREQAMNFAGDVMAWLEDSNNLYELSGTNVKYLSLTDIPPEPEIYRTDGNNRQRYWIQNIELEIVYKSSGTYSGTGEATGQVDPATNYDVTLTSAGHGLNDGDQIMTSGASAYPDTLNGTFTVADSDANLFVLKTEDGSSYVSVDLDIIVTGDVDTLGLGSYSVSGTSGGRNVYSYNDGTYTWKVLFSSDAGPSGDGWILTRSDGTTEDVVYINYTTVSTVPLTGWGSDAGSLGEGTTAPDIAYIDDSFTIDWAEV